MTARALLSQRVRLEKRVDANVDRSCARARRALARSGATPLRGGPGAVRRGSSWADVLAVLCHCGRLECVRRRFAGPGGRDGRCPPPR